MEELGKYTYVVDGYSKKPSTPLMLFTADRLLEFKRNIPHIVGLSLFGPPGIQFSTQPAIECDIQPARNSDTQLCSNQAQVELKYEKEEGEYVSQTTAEILFLSALCLIVNPITAHMYNCHFLAVLSWVVYMTSVLHWWKPRLCWRRTLDMICVRIVSMFYAICSVLYMEFPDATLYVATGVFGVLLYYIGTLFSHRGKQQFGLICHVGLHIIGSINNIIFFCKFSSV